MNSILNSFSKFIFPKYGEYSSIILKNNFVIKKNNHKFLFILSPPYCGSTLLTELISSSGSVSVNNPFGTKEGQKLLKEVKQNEA